VVDKITLLVQELIKGKINSELIGDNTLLTSYFTPRKDPRRFNHVKLRPLTIIGFMEMGKTETAKYLINLSKEHFDRMQIDNIALTGKTMIDVVHYLYNNKDILRDVHVVYLFIDDLFYGGLSSEQSKTKKLNEKYYSDIRHKLEELGMAKGILYVLFSAQRFSLIPVFFRNSPFLLFKGLSIQDRYERNTLLDTLSYSSDENDVYAKKYASLLLDILEAVSEIAYTKYDDSVKALTVVKPIRHKPYIFIVPYLVNIDLINVPFNYSGVFEDLLVPDNTQTPAQILVNTYIKDLPPLLKRMIIGIEEYLNAKPVNDADEIAIPFKELVSLMRKQELISNHHETVRRLRKYLKEYSDTLGNAGIKYIEDSDIIQVEISKFSLIDLEKLMRWLEK